MIQFFSSALAASLIISAACAPPPLRTCAQEPGWDGLLPHKYWTAEDPDSQFLRHYSLFSQMSAEIAGLEKEFAEKGLEFLTEDEKLGLASLREQLSAPVDRAYMYEARGVGEPYTTSQALDDQKRLAVELIPRLEKLLGEKYALGIQRVNRHFNRRFAPIRKEDSTGLSDPVLASAIGLTSAQKSNISRLFDEQNEIVSKSARELAEALRGIRSELRETLLARLQPDKREYYLRVFGDPIDMIGIDGRGELKTVLSTYGQTDDEAVQPMWAVATPPSSATPGPQGAWEFLKSLGSRAKKKDSTEPVTETEVIKIELLEYTLLLSGIVRKEIKIGDETLEAIRKTLLDEKVTVESWEMDREKRLVELLEEEETAVSAITSHLTPDQLRRFRQIEVQARTFKDARTFGILDPAVAVNLELTEADREYISDLAGFAETKMKEVVEAHLEKENERAATLVISLRSVLTEQQIERYRYFLGPDVF